MDHLAAPFAGATNAIGAKTGRSTSSACAIWRSNCSRDSLKAGRSNTTVPSVVAPGGRRRAASIVFNSDRFGFDRLVVFLLFGCSRELNLGRKQFNSAR